MNRTMKLKDSVKVICGFCNKLLIPSDKPIWEWRCPNKDCKRNEPIK